MKRLALEIDDNIHDEIKRKALEEKKTMKAMITELLVNTFFSNKEKKGKK